MSQGIFTLYSSRFGKLTVDDLVSTSVKIALLTSNYIPDRTLVGDSIWEDISAEEISAGSGYTAGGKLLENIAKTALIAGYKFSSDNVIWTATGGTIPTWRYAVMYVSGTLFGVTNPLIGYFLGNADDVDINPTYSGNLLTLVCPPDGWFSVN